MGSKNPSQPRSSRHSDAIRRRSVVALAAALLFTSLFVDVGVARAEYPAGWEDPSLGEVGACLITCGAFWTSSGPIAKYGLAAGCIGCAWKLFGEVNDWMMAFDPGNCYTGILGQPCGGREYNGF
jgi:hypothetical protein